MTLRYRVLVVFGLVVGALTFFGFVAYETAAETGRKKDIALLHQIFSKTEGELRDALAGEGSVEAVLADASLDFGDHLSIVITDREGGIRFQSSDVRSFEHIKSRITPQTGSGQVVDDDYSYTWLTAPITRTQQVATFVYKLKQTQNASYVHQMGISLAFAALIVLWIAGWAAMYIATLVEKLREQKRALRHQAMHDGLTGLPNRTLLSEKLRRYIVFGAEERAEFALCFIDLDRFKEVNDALGHHCGDALLAQVSVRLKASIRCCDTAARLGGDEFAVILQHVDENGTKMVVDKIVDAVEEAILLDGNRLFISCSIGTALFPAHGRDVQTLLRKADIAMYCAKRSGLRHVVFKEDLEQGNEQPLSLMGDLRDAIRSGQLAVYYQPKIALGDRHVTGAEALTRWRHPRLGFIPPPELIVMAEKTGLIASLSLFIVETVFRDYHDLCGNGKTLSVAVNLSSYNLRDPHFVDAVVDLKNRYRISSRHIIFELTESAIVSEPQRIESALQRLAALGFKISLDDFGTGYSSFANLKRLPVDEIKIDKSFILNLDSDEGDVAIVRTTVELGRALGMQVVAEGVESEASMERVAQMGCHEAQGYLISRPLPLDSFVDWLNAAEDRLPPFPSLVPNSAPF